jgi:hypothetical protein
MADKAVPAWEDKLSTIWTVRGLDVKFELAWKLFWF